MKSLHWQPASSYIKGSSGEVAKTEFGLYLLDWSCAMGGSFVCFYSRFQDIPSALVTRRNLPLRAKRTALEHYEDLQRRRV